MLQHSGGGAPDKVTEPSAPPLQLTLTCVAVTVGSVIGVTVVDVVVVQPLASVITNVYVSALALLTDVVNVTAALAALGALGAPLPF